MIGVLTMDQIDEVLKNKVYGRIGCTDGQKVYVVPVNYVYNGSRYIIAHSQEGLKIQMMRKNPNVCFEVDEMLNFTNWKSVIIWGQYQELTSERERYSAMKEFVDRMMNLKISSTAVPPQFLHKGIYPVKPGSAKSIIYRIIIDEKTGRYESD